ncbi:MAG: hypothetical protein ACWGQW_11450, partial [bacterium]
MKPSQTLLRVYLRQFKDLNKEEAKEKVEEFNAMWRSAVRVLDLLEVHLSTELHRLIEDDEKPTNLQLPHPDMMTYYNKGERHMLREIR